MRSTSPWRTNLSSVSVALGLGAALLIEADSSLRGFYRAAYFLPAGRWGQRMGDGAVVDAIGRGEDPLFEAEDERAVYIISVAAELAPHALHEVVALLNRHVNAAVATPEFTQRMLEFGTIAKGSTPDELRARISSDIDKWAAIIKQAGIEAR